MRDNRMLWGALLLLLGALLLLNNLGVISVNVWGLFWPFLLILLGIQILLATSNRRKSGGMESLMIPLEGATSASITTNHGAGRLYVSGTSVQGSLLEGTFGMPVAHSIQKAGSQVNVDLRTRSDSAWIAWPFLSTPNNDWKVLLTSEVPLDLIVKSGASETDLQLSDLQIRSLRIETGASSTRVHLPQSAGYTRVEAHTGAASLVMDVPDHVAARITTRGGLANIRVDSRRFPQNGNFYQSPDFDTATNRVEIEVETGVGSVEIH